MGDVMEVPARTRREAEIASAVSDRLGSRHDGRPVLDTDHDLQFLLDVIALLRADLGVAVTRATVWRRHAMTITGRQLDHATRAVQGA